MKYLRFSPFFALIALLWVGCDRQAPIPEVGSIHFEVTPTVNGATFEKGKTFLNPEGRAYKVDFFRVYLSDISLIKEDGSTQLLSEVNLFDLAEGGPALRVSQGFSSYKIFEGIEPGNYKGIRFGVGLPDRLNVDPSSYAVDHPLSVGNQMYWSWRAGYKFISIEGYVDTSASMNGAALNQPFIYHTGKDSVTSPNPIYRVLEFSGPDDGFSVAENEEVVFAIELDLNKVFFSTNDTIDMVKESFSHSVPGSQFELSVRLTNNLADYALQKMPF